MSIFYTSDLHLGHGRIDMYCNRGFAAKAAEAGNPDLLVPMMNAGIAEAWNALVTPEDTVWVLGDVAMGKLDEALPWVSKLNGTKHLVVGNHDRPFRHTRKARNNPDRVTSATERYLEAGFTTVQDQVLNHAVGTFLVDLNHFPYVGDSEDVDRFPSARPHFHGRPLLCGHMHDLYQVEMYRGVPQINVGIDAWGGAPIPESQVLELLAMTDAELAVFIDTYEPPAALGH